MLDFLARRWVLLGAVYLLVVVGWSCPGLGAWWIGLPVAMFGEGVRTWASGHLPTGGELRQTGPFSVMRNPLEFGSFFLLWGFTWMGGNGWLIVLFPVLFVPVVLRRIADEERARLRDFGDEARRYFQRVPRLVPSWDTHQAAERHWRVQSAVLEHREWIYWLLLAAGAGWFYLRIG